MDISLWGIIRSGYNDKWGVPRQGAYSKSKAILVPFLNDRNIYVPNSSHFTLLWIFNRNKTNADWSKVTKPTSDRAEKIEVPCGRLRATVRPPKAGHGVRVGSLATRSPHRPNPIGLSRCRVIGFISVPALSIPSIITNDIDHIQSLINTKMVQIDPSECGRLITGANIYLPVVDNIDILDRTPIIHIYDCIYNLPVTDVGMPQWVEENKDTFMKLYWTYSSYLNITDNKTELKTGIEHTLRGDTRSAHSKSTYSKGVFATVYMGYVVTYKYGEDAIGSYIYILFVSPPYNDPILKFLSGDVTYLRTQIWIDKGRNLLPLYFDQLCN